MFSTVIKRKSNRLCKYKKLLSVIQSLCKRYDFSNIKYLIIKNGMKFHFATGMSCENGIKCKFFYINLIHKKFVKLCYQATFSQEIAIPVNDTFL